MNPSSHDGRTASTTGSSASKPEEFELQSVVSVGSQDSDRASFGSATSTTGSGEQTGEAIPMSVLSRRDSESRSGRTGSASSGTPLTGLASIRQRANQWWTSSQTRDKVIVGGAILLILVLLIWGIVALVNRKEEDSTTSTTTSLIQSKSTEWPQEYSTVKPGQQQPDGSTIDSAKETLELPITERTTDLVYSSTTGIQPRVTLPEPTEASSVEVTTEEPTVHTSEPTVESTTRPTKQTTRPTKPTSRPTEPTTPTTESTSTTKSHITSLLQYEANLNATLNFNRDPCNDFFDFVCVNSPRQIPILDSVYYDLLVTLDLAMQHERNRTTKKYPRGIQIIVDLYFDCIGVHNPGQVGHAKTLYQVGLQQETLPWPKSDCLKYIFRDHSLVCTRLYLDQISGGADSRAFVSRNIEKAKELVTYLRASFRTNIQQHVTWLDDFSRERVLRKIDHLNVAIGLSDAVFDDTFFNVLYDLPGNGFEGILSGDYSLFPYESRKWRYVDQKNSQLERIKDANWHSLAQDMLLLNGSILTAHYKPEGNKITIPIHWLRLPVFDPNFIAFYNFGALGTVLGHEMTHGFGKKPSNWDENGQHNPGHMWTPVTAALFEQQADCFVRQYGSIPLIQKTLFVNGQLTLEENIADNGGVKIAYYALRSYIESGHSADEPLLHKVNEFTPYQRFFIAYAQSMCEPPLRNAREWESYHDKTHLPSWIRINKALCNFDRFSQAWNCPATSSMNCQDRCVMWRFGAILKQQICYSRICS